MKRAKDYPPLSASERENLRERLLARTAIAPEGCWLLRGALNHGYVRLRVGKGHLRYAHRLAFEVFRHPVPAELSVCHHCDVRNCVNPAHLFLGSHLDNMLDAAKKHRLPSRAAWSYCLRGHALSGANLGTKKNGAHFCRSCDMLTRWTRAEAAGKSPRLYRRYPLPMGDVS
jgi:hypothetical protein